MSLRRRFGRRAPAPEGDDAEQREALAYVRIAAEQLIIASQVLVDEQRANAAEVQALRREVDATAALLRGGLETLIDDELGTRERLRQVRAGAGYEAAWTDPEPLVSVVIPTY